MKTKIEYVVTHGGQAHQDDFLACCLVLSLNSVPIYRREPTPEELENPKIFVIDVGSKYEPDKLNFDHHHDVSLPAAFVLVARHLGLEEKMSRAFSWWTAASRQDCAGIKTAWKEIGVEVENPSQIISPIGGMMVSFFGSFNELCEEIVMWEGDYTDPVYYTMQEIGKRLVSSANKFVDDWDHMFRSDSTAFTRQIDNVAKFQYAQQHNCRILVEPNDRGSGFKLTALSGSGIDFHFLRGMPEVKFVHATGFCAVVEQDFDDWPSYIPA